MMNWTTVSVTLSLLAGLSITRVLSGLTATFRARHRATLDWIPIAWSVVVLLSAIEAWATLGTFSREHQEFSYAQYFLLAGLMVALYAASALVLPPGEIEAGGDMSSHFRDDGRFALPLYSTFLVIGAVVNLMLFGAPSVALWSALDVVMIALPLTAFWARSRRTEAAVTSVYLPLFAIDFVVAMYA